MRNTVQISALGEFTIGGIYNIAVKGIYNLPVVCTAVIHEAKPFRGKPSRVSTDFPRRFRYNVRVYDARFAYKLFRRESSTDVYL